MSFSGQAVAKPPCRCSRKFLAAGRSRRAVAALRRGPKDRPWSWPNEGPILPAGIIFRASVSAESAHRWERRGVTGMHDDEDSYPAGQISRLFSRGRVNSSGGESSTARVQAPAAAGCARQVRNQE